MMNTRPGLLLMLLAGALAQAEDSSVSRLIEEGGDRVPSVTVAPVYPDDARRDRIEGEVQVCYHVDKRGRPIAWRFAKVHTVFLSARLFVLSGHQRTCR